MTLNFPNRSRSYDEQRHSIRFWGYDGAFEICFIVDQSALARISKASGDGEAGALSVFDSARDRILKAALRAYRGHSLRTYFLAAADV